MRAVVWDREMVLWVICRARCEINVVEMRRRFSNLGGTKLGDRAVSMGVRGCTEALTQYG